jgi:hypothetical protein
VGVHYASRAGAPRRGARSICKGERDRGCDRHNSAIYVPTLKRSSASRIHPSQTQRTTQRVRAQPGTETRRSRHRRETASPAPDAERSQLVRPTLHVRQGCARSFGGELQPRAVPGAARRRRRRIGQALAARPLAKTLVFARTHLPSAFDVPVVAPKRLRKAAAFAFRIRLHVWYAARTLRSTCEALPFALAFAIEVTHLPIALWGARGLPAHSSLKEVAPIASRCARQSHPGTSGSLVGGVTVARSALRSAPAGVWAATAAAAPSARSAAAAMQSERLTRFMAAP